MENKDNSNNLDNDNNKKVQAQQPEQQAQPKQQNKLKQFWNWLWNSNSILSWIVMLAIAFIIVKFIFFPLLSLTFATKLPLVIVESSSMHHPGSFIGNIIQDDDAFFNWWNTSGEWYEENDITLNNAENWPLKTGLEKGDIVIVFGSKPEKLELGDVIIFNANQKHPLIHRIVDININNGADNADKIIFSTKGDNNQAQLPVEKSILDDAVVGKAVFRIPKLGWAKLVFVEIAKIFT